jgi:peptide/nickel transport system permease protein
MITYLLRRIGHGILLLFGVSLLLFFLQQAAPADFLTDMRLNSQISDQTMAALRAQYGLDQSVPVRYLHWVKSSIRGDLGISFAYNVPVSGLIWPRIQHTVLLTGPALFISWLIAVPLGVLAAANRKPWIDRLFAGSTSLFLSVPDILLALLALLLALSSGKFPAGGMSSSSSSTAIASSHVRDVMWHMLLPVTALIIGSLAPILRQVRSSVMEVMDTTYFRAAEGHGLGRFTLLFRHALQAAANPLITLFGTSIATLLSTSLLIEVIMSWPGMGPLFLESIQARDLFVVIGSVMFITVFLLAGNLIADILLFVLDPRIADPRIADPRTRVDA